jgi:antitoxin PrlF
MAKNKGKEKGRQGSKGDTGTACRVESVVSVDERGQMVLPKDVRERMGIKAGEKLALVLWEKKGRAFCISLVKAGDLSDSVKSTLGPSMDDLR